MAWAEKEPSLRQFSECREWGPWALVGFSSEGQLQNLVENPVLRSTSCQDSQETDSSLPGYVKCLDRQEDISSRILGNVAPENTCFSL